MRIPSYVLIDKTDPLFMKILHKNCNHIFASINDSFYMRVNSLDKNNVLFLDETIIEGEPFNVVSFYFCKLKKPMENMIVEKRLSKTFVLAEKVITAKEFLKFNIHGITRIDNAENTTIALSTAIGYDGNRINLAKKLLEGEVPIDKPKTLRITH